ncbi:hypothetical protein F5878DRAFT_668117 [Lentinula raphanica]|uniref:Uncharacterized protein n=1 Tax=Lentinula raphanica TaxID=153919 RepID=A0AA38U906_9AGAR|nr:hypothetical protein F5878DRAFT_668117 [Lentinula raphanica]
MSQTCKQPDQPRQCPRPAQMATTISQTCSIGHDHVHAQMATIIHNHVSDMLKQPPPCLKLVSDMLEWPRLCLRHARMATTMSQTCSNGHDHMHSNSHNHVSDMLKQPPPCLKLANSQISHDHVSEDLLKWLNHASDMLKQQ